jgi:hypothetical protein
VARMVGSVALTIEYFSASALLLTPVRPAVGYSLSRCRSPSALECWPRVKCFSHSQVDRVETSMALTTESVVLTTELVALTSELACEHGNTSGDFDYDGRRK